MYKVSVIVPVYNAEKYIKRCVDSVLQQSLDSIEIILVNDCGNDNAFSLANELYAKEENVVFIDGQQNEGPMKAREKGYKVAGGQYLFFLDSDDYLPENSLFVLYDKAIKYMTRTCPLSFVTTYKIKSIAIPPLGAGNGGLDWKQVKPLIENKLSDIDCEILVYEPGHKAVSNEKKINLTPARALLTYMLDKLIKEGTDATAFGAVKLIYITNLTPEHFYWHPIQPVQRGKFRFQHIYPHFRFLK